MEKIEYKWGSYKGYDHAGKERWSGILPNGKKAYRSQLTMMNFLHCKSIPKVFTIHHVNENTTDDSIENLQLMSRIAHQKYHEPRDYSKYGVSSTESPAEYQKARKNDPDKKVILLEKRRKYYAEILKNDPVYVLKNRKRADEHHKKTRGKEKGRNEN